MNKPALVHCTKYENPHPSDYTPVVRPKDPTIGFTGFVPRDLRFPPEKEGGVDKDAPRAKDTMVGFTGFKPR